MVSALFTAVPPAFIVLLAVIGIAVLPRKLGHAAGIVSLLWVVTVSLYADHGTHITATLFGVFDVALFVLDDFTALMGTIFGLFGIAAVIYAYSSEMSRLMTAAALSYVASTMGVVFAGDWLTLIFFWELMAVTSTLLVWQHGGEAVRSGFRYAVYHGVGGSILLFAVIWHYASTGTMLYADTGIAAGWPALLAALGIGVNVGFVGLHQWLPDTYPSPHFAASVFLCVYTTKTGVYAMYRAFPEGQIWIAYMGGAMVVFGAFAALLQYDMRRLLSYSIMSQVGYMVAGLGIGTALATTGAFGHVFNHILYKGLLFMAVGAIIYRTGINDMYNLGGLWRVMPITFVAFLIGTLSTTAMPGFNAFISKGMLMNAAKPKHVKVGGKTLYWLLKLGAIGNILAFLKLGYYVFFNGDSEYSVEDAKPGQTIGMGLLAVLCVLFGVWWTGLVGLLPTAHDLHLHPYSMGHITDTAMLAAISAVAFIAIWKPLSRFSHRFGGTSILYRETFYMSKFTVYVATAVFAWIDRAAVTLVQTLYTLGAHPETAVATAAQALPDPLLNDHVQLDPREPARTYLMPGIGASILILIGVLTVVLLILM